MLSNKYENVGEYNKAKNIYEKIININNNSLLKERASFQLAKLETYNNEINQLTQFIASYPDSKNISECYKLLVKHYKQIKNEEKEIEIYKKWINLFKEDFNILNSFAWRMSQLEKELKLALELSRIAINLTLEDPIQQAMIIDTEAEILWKMGKNEEAILVIEKAIKISPKDNYYKSQKEKFEDTILIES